MLRTNPARCDLLQDFLDGATLFAFRRPELRVNASPHVYTDMAPLAQWLERWSYEP